MLLLVALLYFSATRYESGSVSVDRRKRPGSLPHLSDSFLVAELLENGVQVVEGVANLSETQKHGEEGGLGAIKLWRRVADKGSSLHVAYACGKGVGGGRGQHAQGAKCAPGSGDQDESV